jgi:hypothetical protein
MITYKGLFDLTAREKRLLEPLPPGATTVQLVDRLVQLEDLRCNEFKRMVMKIEAPGTTALDIAEYEKNITWIGICMQATALRARAAWLRSPLATRRMLAVIRHGRII